MDIESITNYCMAKPGVTAGFPFDETTLVFKVMGKMFAITDADHFEYINLKCDPERSEEMRAQYDYIRPGYHMNKTHWNSVYPEAGSKLICELIDHSYDLIVAKLPKKVKEELALLSNSE